MIATLPPTSRLIGRTAELQTLFGLVADVGSWTRYVRCYRQSMSGCTRKRSSVGIISSVLSPEQLQSNRGAAILTG